MFFPFSLYRQIHSHQESRMTKSQVEQTLPKTYSTLEVDGHPDGHANKPEQEPGSLLSVGEVRLLILDDDESVCRVIKAALAQTDFQVDVVSDPTRMKGQLQA